MVRLLSFLAVLLLFTGCSSVEPEGHRFEIEDPTLVNDPTLLVGTWEWVSSTYYYTGPGRPVIRTPASSGSSEMLVLHEDGTAEEYRDGDLHREGEYTVSGRQIRLPASGPAQFGVSDVKLVTTTAYLDGPETVYRRVQE